MPADLRDAGDAGRTTPDGARSTSAPPPSAVDGSTTTGAEQDGSEPERRRQRPLPQASSAAAAADKNCSAREAIVRSAQISALLASKNFRW